MDPKRIWNLHLKGVKCNPGFEACVETFPDEGQIRLIEQFRALLRNGYRETLSVECEFKALNLTQAETTKRAIAGVLKLTSCAVSGAVLENPPH
jgi:sugar phosphate isomerase/epimerase